MPDLSSSAVGFITMENKVVPGDAGRVATGPDHSLVETLARLTHGVHPPVRVIGRAVRERWSSLGSSQGVQQRLDDRWTSTPHGEETLAPSATVCVEADLSQLVVQLKAEAEALRKRIAAALDIAQAASAFDGVSE